METLIGPHRIILEEDVLFAYVSGPWLLDELKQFLLLCEETKLRLGSVYLVTIVGPGYDLPPPSRKYIGEWSRAHEVTGNVLAGAPFAMRALITIMTRALQLLGASSSGVVFTNTEAEARAWIRHHKLR
jgi:hypothetical protein